MTEWIEKLFCSKCKFWECSCFKRPKAQLLKETLITRRKCCFNIEAKELNQTRIIKLWQIKSTPQSIHSYQRLTKMYMAEVPMIQKPVH